ncbi:hypothetical protein NC651_016918 [Populus alba x Populus x berolinensis]|nr:hypothetical protein NC651_016918 [Populus alba x Populus x berolinensis]
MPEIRDDSMATQKGLPSSFSFYPPCSSP